LVKSVNGLVHQLNTLGTNAIHIAVSPVSLGVELARLRERRGAKPQAAPDAAPVAETMSTPGAASLRDEQSIAAWIECVNKHCRCPNAGDARFCRRCGKVLA